MNTRMKPTCGLLGAFVLAASAGVANAAPPATSPYVTDAQESHVEDATSRGIMQVNNITCMMSNMRPDALVNQGPYAAMVDQTKCDPRLAAGSSDSAGASAGSQAPSYVNAIVDSARATNDDPMRTRMWIALEEDGFEGTISANTTATAPPGASTPYGVFRLDYCGGDGVSAQCMMQGYLEGAADGLTYFEEENNEYGQRTVALRLTSVGAETGAGRMLMDREDGSMMFSFAYDAAHFRRSDGTLDQCFSRDANDPGTGFSVSRYGLYDAVTGERIERTTGFPIEYTQDGRTYQGYLGYWGMSISPAVASSIPSGAEVTRVEYVSGEEPTRTPYTLVRAAGKLTRHDRHERTLASTDKIRFSTWVGDATGFYSGAESNAQYVMYWDDQTSVFKVVGRDMCTESGCTTQSLPVEESVQPTFWSDVGGIRGWSEALGGDVFFDLHGAAGGIDSSVANVVYRTQETVYPSQMPATLYCLRDCPSAATLGDYFQPGSSAQSPFEPASFNAFGPTTESFQYQADTATALLDDGAGEPVVYTNREMLENNPSYRWGVRTGLLFTNLDDARCLGDTSKYCESQVDALDVYYTWETGADQWNQFAAVKDAGGSIVTFDPPMQVEYAVPNGAAYGDYAGKTIVLQYDGFGNLSGIPSHCVSALSNETVACDAEDARYVSAFMIPMDETTGRVTSGSTTYLVKWLGREIRFAIKPAGDCASLALPDGVALPTAADMKNPADTQSPVYIGTKPVVTGAPRVIHGEVMY